MAESKGLLLSCRHACCLFIPEQNIMGAVASCLGVSHVLVYLKYIKKSCDVWDANIKYWFYVKFLKVSTEGFFFFFLGYRIVVHSCQAKEPLGHQTNLRYAGATA